MLLLFICIQSLREEFRVDVTNLLFEELLRFNCIHLFPILWFLLGIMLVVFIMALSFYIVSRVGQVHFPIGLHVAGLFIEEFAFTGVVVNNPMQLTELALIC